MNSASNTLKFSRICDIPVVSTQPITNAVKEVGRFVAMYNVNSLDPGLK